MTVNILGPSAQALLKVLVEFLIEHSVTELVNASSFVPVNSYNLRMSLTSN